MTKQDENQEYEIRDEAPHDFFTQIPNLVGEMLTTPQSYRLYAHLKRVAGTAGKCWQNTRTLALACKMSAGMVSSSKNELTHTTPPLIKIGWEEGAGGKHHVITITDVWMLNHRYYSGESVHILNANGESVQNMNAKRSEYETKNIPDKNIQEEEKPTGGGKRRRAPRNPDEPFRYEYPEALKAYGDTWEALYTPARRALDASEYVLWVNGGGKSGARGFRHYAKAGITPDEMAQAYREMVSKKLTVKNPNSLWAFAFDIHAKNSKRHGGKSLADIQAERRAEFEENIPFEEASQ